ncbi:hypothetical protein JCGZ_06492 [Jatropha curcas]|uniref:Uncharacterized protein n=1 Tax=Jatropha curcas TaxID=180498 RepID=A0A067LQ99_JATCU|nr:hypothetical protein JCGZ_06492 [Jatropha curcas]
MYGFIGKSHNHHECWWLWQLPVQVRYSYSPPPKSNLIFGLLVKLGASCRKDCTFPVKIDVLATVYGGKGGGRRWSSGNTPATRWGQNALLD